MRALFLALIQSLATSFLPGGVAYAHTKRLSPRSTGVPLLASAPRNCSRIHDTNLHTCEYVMFYHCLPQQLFLAIKRWHMTVPECVADWAKRCTKQLRPIIEQLLCILLFSADMSAASVLPTQRSRSQHQ